MLTIPLVLALWFGPVQAQAPPPAQAPAAARTPQLDVHVTDRKGAPIEGAHVIAEGPVSRDGMTDRNGAVTFKNTTAGTYRFRVSHDGFFTLEKEAAARAAVTTSVDAALSAAPPPPPPPPPPAPAPAPAPAPVAPVLSPGEPKAVSIPDLAEAEPLKGDPVKESAIGCSGATSAKLIQTRDTIAAHTHADADEMLYVVAGDGTLKMGTKEYPVTSGWFMIVPRGMEHSLTRKGRNPIILLSIVGGAGCGSR